MVARSVRDAEVAGSNPASPTNQDFWKIAKALGVGLVDIFDYDILVGNFGK